MVRMGNGFQKSTGLPYKHLQNPEINFWQLDPVPKGIPDAIEHQLGTGIQAIQFPQ